MASEEKVGFASKETNSAIRWRTPLSRLIVGMAWLPTCRQQQFIPLCPSSMECCGRRFTKIQIPQWIRCRNATYRGTIRLAPFSTGLYLIKGTFASPGYWHYSTREIKWWRLREVDFCGFSISILRIVIRITVSELKSLESIGLFLIRIARNSEDMAESTGLVNTLRPISTGIIDPTSFKVCITNDKC